VRVINAAICSRGTGSDGLYVLGDVPLVNPEKNAPAIEQKKIFEPGTSLNGRVMLCPPQLLVSANVPFDARIKLKASDMIQTRW
jgi:hypothetical protein